MKIIDYIILAIIISCLVSVIIYMKRQKAKGKGGCCGCCSNCNCCNNCNIEKNKPMK